MTRNETLNRLATHEQTIRAMGAQSLFLYGSTARDEATPGSDVDLYLDYAADVGFNAFDLVGIKLFLEEAIGLSVDLTTRDGLHPRLRDRIERSAIQVF